MASARLTSLYKIIKDCNFESEKEITKDVLCTICNKILINAHSGPCGCRYCLECITAHLDGNDKYCPGNTVDCNIDLLNINTNVFLDRPMNIKISRLMVKCAEGDCDERVELRNLEDHFQVCNWRPTNCPYFNVGCANVQMANNMMEQHILSENHAHTKLLMDCIDVLRNEFGDMKEQMRELRLDVKGKESLIDELRAVIAQQSREIDLLGEEMVAVGNVNRQMADKINGLGTKMESYEAANLEARNNGDKQMCEMTQVNDKLEQIQLKGIVIDEEIGGLEERVKTIAAQQNQLNYGEFVWPIDNFSDKRQKAQHGIEPRIYSEAFMSHRNGYKMCLSVVPDGFGVGQTTHLSVFIHLMRAPFDDTLQWPIKCDVTFALINRQSRLSQHSFTIKSADSSNDASWQKPIGDRNIGNGNYTLIRLDELMADVALSGGNRIFIKCVVRTY